MESKLEIYTHLTAHKVIFEEIFARAITLPMTMTQSAYIAQCHHDIDFDEHQQQIDARKFNVWPI